jgi:hypothetical protein
LQSTSATSGMGQQVRTTAGNLVEVCDCLCFALSATTASSKHHTRCNVANAGCHCLIKDDLLHPAANAFADIMVNVRKAILVRSAQAGFEVLALQIRMWELLPVFLMIAISSALLIEVWHPLSLGACWCTLDVNTAGQICLTSCGMVFHRACTCLMSG